MIHEICYCVQERLQALELWQTAAQELEHLQQTHQRSISDGKILDAQRQKLKVQQCGSKNIDTALVQFEHICLQPLDGALMIEIRLIRAV